MWLFACVLASLLRFATGVRLPGCRCRIAEDGWCVCGCLLDRGGVPLQVRIAEYQQCGQFNMPDMMTIGMGAQSQSQYRAQFFLWAVLASPLIMGNDIRSVANGSVTPSAANAGCHCCPQ